ncbi:MAG TPA: transcription-repair coupling factor [Thermomicrobiales bacterium]|nr:transcription-repair coupling factor [Thermomicrobiales bacterium]
MLLTALLDNIAGDLAVRELVQALGTAEPGAAFALDGVPPAARAVMLATLAREHDRPLLIVTSRQETALRLHDSLACYLDPREELFLWPAHDALPYEQLPGDPVASAARLGLLDRLLQAREGELTGGFVLIASARGLQGQLMAPAALTGWREVLRPGQQLDLGGLLARWVDAGYEPVSEVAEPGQFSRRGGLIDVYPTGFDQPVRIELFGDEVDSLRPFDVRSQRSTGRLQQVTILPASELPLWERDAALEQLEQIDTSRLRPEVADEWARSLRRLGAGEAPFAPELLAPYFTPAPASLLDYLPADALVVFDEPGAVQLAARQVEAQAEELRVGFEAGGELPPGLRRPYHTWDAIVAGVAGAVQVTLGQPDVNAPASRATFTVNGLREPTAYGSRVTRLANDLRTFGRAGVRVVIVTEQGERLRELLAEREVHPQIAADRLPAPLPLLTMIDGDLSNGWVYDPDTAVTAPGLAGGEDGATQHQLHEGTLVVLTDHDIFGTTRVIRRASRRTAAQHQAFVRALTPGQYVVHLEHGIARYTGMITRTVGEPPPEGGPAPAREFMTLEYAAGDRLFVPIDQTDRVAPYTGTGDTEPVLNRLGSQEWTRTKHRVQRAVADMADELLTLYAAREATPGHTFSPDTPWDHELEESFPYVETEDQLRAIREVKGDMERDRPMDRLVTGDVGFGKTEVAIRAAFKAVNDGTQVAVLVPTTVLALQHARTFKERLAPFPVRIEMLSRLRAPAEREKVKRDLAAGQVDIVIGTHALLGDDVRFRNLGLLVVDEEQRFGVAHKEKLKKLRATVDVLTMTATPIPRTLHSALAGLRDLSVIDTPPAERLPIRTFVTPYTDTLAREVILREIDRGGQVYFVHNRVQTLAMIAAHLAELVPEARIRIGHGQMDQGQLEKVMLAFVRGEFDVLVCTTIIESGIDIPTVNTIIIDDAPLYGLTQLHQLRGRVGRSGSRAYAYLLYREGKPMTPDAQERLETIGSTTELGAGLRIAMKDLELRGAGNLLGAEQSGHIAAVGFDLYVQMLAAAVEERRTGVAVEEERPVLLDLPLTALLPADYITDPATRVREYRRIAAVRAQPELDELLRELADRFGPLPDEVRALGYLAAIKIQAVALGLEAVTYRDNSLTLRPVPTGRLDQFALRRAFKDALFIGPTSLRLNTSDLTISWEEALDRLFAFLREAKTRLEAVTRAALAPTGGRERRRHAVNE